MRERDGVVLDLGEDELKTIAGFLPTIEIAELEEEDE